jgi:hypothetical protein
MEIRITQVTIGVGETTGIVIGVPTNDETKIVFAGADWRAAFALGEAITQGMEPVVEVPDWAILRILELP